MSSPIAHKVYKKFSDAFTRSTTQSCVTILFGEIRSADTVSNAFFVETAFPSGSGKFHLCHRPRENDQV